MLNSINSQATTKRAMNVSLAENLITEAKALHINISQAAEAGVMEAIARKRTEVWLKENQEAINSSNDFVEQRGLPLTKHNAKHF